jgi:methionyl-tRNA formyltransferase
MKFVFMGTPDFSVGIFNKLVDAGNECLAVITQPDKPKGRGHEVQFTPVKEAAIAKNIPVLQPAKVSEEGFANELQKLGADVFVVAAFGQILKKNILEMPKYGCINVHASLLPKYRGASPIQWAVINGEPVSGVTTMQMGEGLDTGDILLKEEVILAEDETGGSLFDKLSEVGADLAVKR